MPSVSEEEVSNYIRYLNERERKKAKGEATEFKPFDLYFVGKVTNISGQRRVLVTNGAKGSIPFDARIPGKLCGKKKRDNLISLGSYLLVVADESITKPVYDIKAVVDRKSVDIINKIFPINESLLVSSADGKKDDGIEFDRSDAKDSDLEDADIDNL